MNIATIPARLAELAANHQLSSFSRASGLPIKTLDTIACGRGDPKLSTLLEIADALKVFKPVARVPKPASA